MFSVSKQVRDVVTTLMADETVGFNPTLMAICDDYEISPFSIDFSDNSKNFFAAYYNAKDLSETSSFRFPIVCLYTIKSQNTNENKFVTFSGSVMIGIDTYLSFGKSSALADTESLADAVEATYYKLFNSESNQSFYQTGGVIYNGDLLIQRGPVAKGGSNWLQLMQSRLTFDLIVQ